MTANLICTLDTLESLEDKIRRRLPKRRFEWTFISFITFCKFENGRRLFEPEKQFFSTEFFYLCLNLHRSSPDWSLLRRLEGSLGVGVWVIKRFAGWKQYDIGMYFGYFLLLTNRIRGHNGLLIWLQPKIWFINVWGSIFSSSRHKLWSIPDWFLLLDCVFVC